MPTHKAFIDEDFVYLPVRTILRKEYAGNVYDLTLTSGEHSFATLSGIVHNCPRARQIDFAVAIYSIFWGTKKTYSRKVATFNWQLGQSNNYCEAPIVRGHERLRDKNGEILHPTQKPERVMSWLTAYLTNPYDIILDPFAGTGTTLAAAKKLSRYSIGIEKSEEYWKAAVKRISSIPAPLI